MKITFRNISKRLGEQFERLGIRRSGVSRARMARPSDLEPIEGSVQSALHPVEPPHDFRETLRSNLQVAAQQRQAGLRVESPRPFREIILITLALWLVVTTLIAILLCRRGQPRPQA